LALITRHEVITAASATSGAQRGSEIKECSSTERGQTPRTGQNARNARAKRNGISQRSLQPVWLLAGWLDPGQVLLAGYCGANVQAHVISTTRESANEIAPGAPHLRRTAESKGTDSGVAYRTEIKAFACIRIGSG
jgi:hypothetical protein